MTELDSPKIEEELGNWLPLGCGMVISGGTLHIIRFPVDRHRHRIKAKCGRWMNVVIAFRVEQPPETITEIRWCRTCQALL